MGRPPSDKSTSNSSSILSLPVCDKRQWYGQESEHYENNAVYRAIEKHSMTHLSEAAMTRQEVVTVEMLSIQGVSPQIGSGYEEQDEISGPDYKEVL